MQIGVVGPMGSDSFGENIGDALQQMGHNVIPLGPASPRHRWPYLARAAWLVRQGFTSLDERIQVRIARRALDSGCEIVINSDSYLMPGVVKRMRSTGVRVAFWFPDHVANLGRQLMLLADYDALFFKDAQFVERTKALLDLPIHYLPEACNPRWHRPLVPAGTEPYLVVPANTYPYRVRLLERLLAKGIPLKIYGSDIPRWVGESPIRAVHTGPVYREEKARVYRSAAGVLSSMHPAEMTGANGRLFQAAGCGAAVLTELRPAVPRLFDIGFEILAFRDFDELVEQATRVLNEPGLTAQLGDAAARRAHRDHTFRVRLTTILEHLS